MATVSDSVKDSNRLPTPMASMKSSMVLLLVPYASFHSSNADLPSSPTMRVGDGATGDELLRVTVHDSIPVLLSSDGTTVQPLTPGCPWILTGSGGTGDPDGCCTVHVRYPSAVMLGTSVYPLAPVSPLTRYAGGSDGDGLGDTTDQVSTPVLLFMDGTIV